LARGRKETLARVGVSQAPLGVGARLVLVERLLELGDGVFDQSARLVALAVVRELEQGAAPADEGL
jgi:hypothetical protein